MKLSVIGFIVSCFLELSVQAFAREGPKGENASVGFAGLADWV